MNEHVLTDTESTSTRLARLTKRFIEEVAGDVFRSHRERTVAREMSRRSLRMLREVQAEARGLDGYYLYHEVVARQTGLARDEVVRLLERAETSFASWPVERDLRFRDVVQYLVIQTCLKAEPTAVGIRSPLAEIVSEEIPETL